MAIAVDELTGSPEIDLGDEPVANLRYLVTGTDDGATASEAAENQIPTTAIVRMHGQAVTVYRQTIALRWKAPGAWTAIGRFGQRPAKESGSPGEGHFEATFDISGRSTRMYYSRETVSSYAGPLLDEDGNPIPNTSFSTNDFRGGINVDPDSLAPKGLDVEIPTLSFSETHYLPNTTVNQSFIDTLYAMVGTVNSHKFRSKAPGELLMTRVSGSRRNAEQWALSFSWAFEPNETDLVIGGIAIAEKRGWDYLWIFNFPHPNEKLGGLIKVPHSAYVERVFRYTDHNALGI